MGGMFHGGIGLGGGTDNRVKSIQTRSGHRIVFTEDESIIITDKSGNEIHLGYYRKQYQYHCTGNHDPEL
jgi:hypothetical protein